MCAIAFGNSKGEASGDRGTMGTPGLRRSLRGPVRGSGLGGKERKRVVPHENAAGVRGSVRPPPGAESGAASQPKRSNPTGLTHEEKAVSIQ
ncbi:MAG: hypothetical protein KatS3mg106_566 [Gemmataceae bacterium]|nr:MAG: hypothetical protein KatS3mg106_566 [Gemmataceae bacterium]